MKSETLRKDVFEANVPVVNLEKCTGCGLCAEICLVYDVMNGKAVRARPALCIRCGACGSFCPAGAIEGSCAEKKRLTKRDMDKLPSPESLQFLFKSRRSVRRYKPEPLQQEHIETVLEAGRYTPTGSNTQGIKYLIVNDRREMVKLRQMLLPIMDRLFAMATHVAKLPFVGERILGERQAHDIRAHLGQGVRVISERNRKGEDRLFYGAPALMIVYGEKQDEAMAFSCHAAIFNCSMMAHLLGIGCCLNSFSLMAINYNAKVKKYLGIPKTDKCFGVMTMGYQNVKYKSLIQRDPVNVRYL